MKFIIIKRNEIYEQDSLPDFPYEKLKFVFIR
jgi:hypothetical protein